MGACERTSLLAAAPAATLSAQDVETGGIKGGVPIHSALDSFRLPPVAEGRQFRFSTWVNDNRRILLVAMVVTSFVVCSLLLVSGFIIKDKKSDHPKPSPEPTPAPLPFPHNVTQLCEELPTALANQYQWVQSTVLPSISNSIVNLWNMFCAGQQIMEPAVISQGANMIATLTNTFANLSTQMVTGVLYYPGQFTTINGLAEIPYSLVAASTADFATTERILGPYWGGIEGIWSPSWSGATGWTGLPVKITADTVNRIFYVCIDMACKRKDLMQPVFSLVNNTLTYNCTNVAHIDELITGLAGWTGGWQSRV